MYSDCDTEGFWLCQYGLSWILCWRTSMLKNIRVEELPCWRSAYRRSVSFESFLHFTERNLASLGLLKQKFGIFEKKITI